jgi:hypothetical protein
MKDDLDFGIAPGMAELNGAAHTAKDKGGSCRSSDGAAPQRDAKRLVGFIRMPWGWADALASNDVGGKVWAVACHILYETWRAKGQPIKVPNGMLERFGVSRDAKIRALHKLEQLGLVSVEWRPRKSPIVTILG